MINSNKLDALKFERSKQIKKKNFYMYSMIIVSAICVVFGFFRQTDIVILLMGIVIFSQSRHEYHIVRLAYIESAISIIEEIDELIQKK